MNLATWLTHFLLFTGIVTSFAMEKNPHAKRWQEMATVLPDLVKYDGLSASESKYSGMSVGTTRKIAYLAALQPGNLQGIDVLEQLGEPLNIAHDELRGGAWSKRDGMQELRLARLARGVLLQSQGDSDRAEHEFKEVERSVNQLLSSQKSIYSFTSCEKPLGHAASCCRLLMNNQHAIAFGELLELKELAWMYPCWQRFVVKQCQMLIDAQYQPAFEVLKELAQGGVADAQFHLMQDACAQAATKKDVEAQSSQFKLLVPYLESLMQHPQYASLSHAVTHYLAAVSAFESKQHPQAIRHLRKLLDHRTSMPQANQLARCLFEAMGLKGDEPARCYAILGQLQNADKTVRRAGIKSVKVLMQELMGEGKDIERAWFDASGIVAQLDEMVRNNNGTASVLLAKWKCYQALVDTVTHENGDATKVRLQVVKLLAELGLKSTQQQPELLKDILMYADGVIAQCEGNQEEAAKKFIALLDVSRQQHELGDKMRIKAQQFLAELSNQGEWRARCWANNAACVADGKMISEQHAQSCCQLAADMLNNAPKELIEGVEGAQVYAHVRTLAQAGNKEANYLASRFLFRTVHFKCAQTGLDCQGGDLLRPAFRDACTASLAGVAGAKPFQDALALYIKILKNTLEGKHDLAVESALQLAGLDLPAPEKSLCLAFVRHQLKEQVARKNNSACAWFITDLLGSDNATEVAHVLELCANIFSDFTEDDFAATSVETWQSRLQPYKTHKLVEKLMAVHAVCKEPLLRARFASLLSLCHMLQASVAYQFFENENFGDKEAMLKKALSYAKEAYEISSSTTGRNILCLCYLGLASFYTQHERWDEELQMLKEGVKLKHPHSMFVYALGELSTAASGARIERSEFDAHIAMLHEAHALGSLHAGDLLAEHYFDGPLNPFECGYSLDQDMDRAYRIAKKVGDTFAQASRIVGYLDFCRAQREGKKKGSRDCVVKSIELLVCSAQLGCEQAYAHLVEICKAQFCTASEINSIVSFLEKKSVERLPVALCAMGSILLANQQFHARAIQYFNEAARLSKGMFGHYELIELYVSDPKKYMGGPHLLTVAENCVALLNAHIDIRTLGSNAVGHFGKVLLFLQEFKGDEEYKRKAESYYATLVEGFRRIGIDVSRVEMPEAEIQRAVAANEMNVVLAGTMLPAADSLTQVEESTASVLLTEGFLQGLIEIDRAFEDMKSKQAQVILNDRTLFQALEAGAQEKNTLSCYLFSKYLLHRAEQDQAILETFDTRKAYYQQAVVVARRALQQETDNKRYARQFAQASLQACAFYQSGIAVIESDSELCTELMAFFEPFVREQELAGISATDAKKIVRAASRCVYALACQGWVPALSLYVETYLKSQSMEQQNTALEAMYRCALTYEEERGETLRACGILEVFTTHYECIKHFADAKNNGHAALAVVKWLSLHARANLDQPGVLSAAGVQQSQRDTLLYIEKAKNAGCPLGVYLWHKQKLFGKQLISESEFLISLKALEKAAATEDIVAELMMELYMGVKKLPCGHEVKPDKARAKKIALAIKDRSVNALGVLARLAQEEQEHTKAILYKLEIIKRSKELPAKSLLELAQNCGVANVYPREVLEYLESQRAEGDLEALQALGSLAMRQKQFDRAVGLLSQAIEQKCPFLDEAHMDLAFAYVDPNWSERNIKKAMEHMEIGICHMAAKKMEPLSVTDGLQTFAMQLIKLMFNSLMTNDLALRQEAGQALERLVDLMQEHRYYDAHSIEYLLSFAILHSNLGTDYMILRRYIVSALELLQTSKHSAVDRGFIGNAVSIILSRLQTDAFAKEEEGNAQRATQLGSYIRDLLTLIAKEKITYYMVTALEMPKK